MLKTFAAAGLAFGLALSPLAALAQSDMSDKPMSDTARKKPTMKHHSMHKKPMAKPMAHPDTMKSGDTQQKM